MDNEEFVKISRKELWKLINQDNRLRTIEKSVSRLHSKFDPNNKGSLIVGLKDDEKIKPQFSYEHDENGFKIKVPIFHKLDKPEPITKQRIYLLNDTHFVFADSYGNPDGDVIRYYKWDAGQRYENGHHVLQSGIMYLVAKGHISSYDYLISAPFNDGGVLASEFYEIMGKTDKRHYCDNDEWEDPDNPTVAESCKGQDI